MSPYARFVVQPLPYSRSLLYPLLLKDSRFLQWYQTHAKFDETYRFVRGSPKLSYSYSYHYHTQPVLRDLHIQPVIDTITCNLLVSHDKRLYDESIMHKIYYLHSHTRNPNELDYVIQTDHAIKVDGNVVNYNDIDKYLVDKLHLHN
jgi:hypothetical protein